jgi:hypothetical protein
MISIDRVGGSAVNRFVTGGGVGSRADFSQRGSIGSASDKDSLPLAEKETLARCDSRLGCSEVVDIKS